MKPIAIDAFDFGRHRERREGEVLIAQLPRLAKECVETLGVLNWCLAGGSHDSGHPQLNIQVTGDVTLLCQRCLQSFAFRIASESVLVLALDEPQADMIESMLDDETLDVIVGSKTMSVIDLIEDEALLAIPQAPKHDQCPGHAMRSSAPEADSIDVKPSPFAVLKNMKH